MEGNQETLELLKQIRDLNRRQMRSSWIMCAMALVAAVCCVVIFVAVLNILPQVNSILPQTDAIMTRLNTVMGDVEQISGELAALDMEGMVSDVDALVVTGQESLEQVMEKLNAVDFETLNKAIVDLAAVIEPLARVSNWFK